MIVPALIYVAAFRQHVAIGTSVAVLLLPMQLAAAYEYYRRGNIDIRPAAIIAGGTLAGAWLGDVPAAKVSKEAVMFVA